MFEDRFSLSGQVALVTGASRGIGAAIANDLAEAGAKVVGTATSEAGAQAISDRFASGGLTGRGAVLNVADRGASATLIEDIRGNEGPVTVLVNNAGITRDGLLLRMKNEDWDAVLDTNLKGAFLCIRAAAKVMSKQRSGRIINISSVVGEMGNAGQANYCASKAGLLGLTKSVARELARRNVTVNAITPGFIVTDMTDDMTDKARQAMTEQIPLGRLGEVDDIANAVIFLASDQSSYITGQVLGINGGMYM